MAKPVWIPDFTGKKVFNLGKSYLEVKLEARGEGVAAIPNALLDADLVPTIMREDDANRIDAEADKVEAFCGGVTLRSLVAPTGPGPSLLPTALLDERHTDGSIISRPSNQGPLTARQLYEVLKESHSRASSLPPSAGTEAPLDTRRRHTYITDMDRWSIAAVFGTVLPYQRRAICSMVYRHLNFRPWINVNIPTEGRRFELAFNLPHTLMRDSVSPNADPRQWNDGSPLRRHTDVSFLKTTDAHTRIYTYEATLSCLVVGKQHSTWDSWRLDDTYYDPRREGKKWVEVYAEQNDDESEGTEGARFDIDPSSRGASGRVEELNSELDAPALEPRQFFLRALRYGLEQVTDEWKRIIDRIDSCIRHYQQDLSDKTQPDRKIHAPSTILCMAATKKLSKSLLTDVASGTNAIQRFLHHHETLFRTELCNPLVAKITAVQREWEAMESELENRLKHCVSFIECQQVYFEHEAREAGRRSLFVSKFIYPVAIGAAMFSMEAHVLPFKANTAAFVVVVVVIAALVDLGYEPSRYWHVVRAPTARLRFPRRYGAMWPERLRRRPTAECIVAAVEPPVPTMPRRRRTRLDVVELPARTLLRQGRDFARPRPGAEVMEV